MYKLKGQIREAVNYLAKNKGLIVGEVDRHTIAFPVNQGVPENVFKNLDVFPFTMNTYAYVSGLSKGDIYLSYNGSITFLKKILNKFFEERGFKNYRGNYSYKDRNGLKGAAFARNIGRLEMVIFNSIDFVCNSKELTREVNDRKVAMNVSLDEVADYISKEMGFEIETALPRIDYPNIKNMRGVALSCTNSNKIFPVREVKYQVKIPKVWSKMQRAFVPKIGEPYTDLCYLNKTRIVDDFYFGELTLFLQGNNSEEEIKQFLRDKYDCEFSTDR